VDLVGAKCRHELGDAKIADRSAKALGAIAGVDVGAVAQRSKALDLEDVPHALALQAHLRRKTREHERPVAVPSRFGCREDLLHAGTNLGARVRGRPVHLHSTGPSADELFVTFHAKERLADRGWRDA